MTQDKLSLRANIFTDIFNYVAEMKAKWVTGELDIDATWDEYKQTLSKMSVDDYVAMYQEAYDDYKAQ